VPQTCRVSSVVSRCPLLPIGIVTHFVTRPLAVGGGHLRRRGRINLAHTGEAIPTRCRILAWSSHAGLYQINRLALRSAAELRQQERPQYEILGGYLQRGQMPWPHSRSTLGRIPTACHRRI
jgi:hypothetical protein